MNTLPCLTAFTPRSTSSLVRKFNAPTSSSAPQRPQFLGLSFSTSVNDFAAILFYIPCRCRPYVPFWSIFSRHDKPKRLEGQGAFTIADYRLSIEGGSNSGSVILM